MRNAIAVLLVLGAASPAHAQKTPTDLSEDEGDKQSVEVQVAAPPFVPANPPSPPADPYEVARAQAKAEADAGRPDEAAAILERALASYPDDFALQLQRASYLSQARAYARAATAFRAALAISPESREAGIGLVDALASAGDFAGALVLTTGLVARYPEPALFDKHAFYLFESGDYHAAETWYRRALALDAHDADAMLGLGWCAQRLGHRAEARRHFDAVIAAAPGSASAREGLDLVGPEYVFIPRAYGQAWFFTNDASRPALWNLTAGMDLRIHDHYTLGAYYRHIGDATLPANAVTNYTYSQDEAHLSFAYDARRFGLTIYGALGSYPAWSLDSTATGQALTGLGGVQARLRFWGTFSAGLTWSYYPSGGLAQIDAGAALPLSRWFDLVIAGRVEIAADHTYGGGRVEARVHGQRWLVAATGLYGSEWRPYDFDSRSIYNVNGTLDHGAGLYSWFPLSARLDGYVGGAWEHWVPEAGSTGLGNSLRVTLGLGAWF